MTKGPFTPSASAGECDFVILFNDFVNDISYDSGLRPIHTWGVNYCVNFSVDVIAKLGTQHTHYWAFQSMQSNNKCEWAHLVQYKSSFSE